jgi:hypothetical protein
MTDYAIAHLDEIDEATDGRAPWRPVRHHFGITSFGINAWTGRDAGDRIINEHEETSDGEEEDEELYLVHSGRARFELDDQQVDAPAGTFVYAAPRVKRTAFAEEPGTTIVAIGGRRGQAYQPYGWEVWRPFHNLYEQGDYDAAIEQARGPVEASGLPMPLYNLACCEALAGRKSEAIEHLRVALEAGGGDRLRSLAAEDSDLDAIRDEPAFKELVG